MPAAEAAAAAATSPPGCITAVTNGSKNCREGNFGAKDGSAQFPIRYRYGLSRAEGKLVKNAAIFSQATSPSAPPSDSRRLPPELPFGDLAEIFYVHNSWRSYRAGALSHSFCRFDFAPAMVLHFRPCDWSNARLQSLAMKIERQ